MEEGFDVYAICDFTQNKHVKIQLTEMGVCPLDINLSKSTFSLIKDFIYFFNLLKIFSKYKPQAVFSYTLKPIVYGSIAAKIINIENICSMFSGLGYLFTDKKKGFRVKLGKLLVFLANCCADRIIFHNKDDYQELLKQKIVSSNKKILIVNGSGVSLEEFKFSENTFLNNEINVLMISRFIKEKGVREYMEAAEKIISKYDNVTFNLAGYFEEGEDTLKKDDLKKYFAYPKIKNLGKIERVFQAIQRCNIYVLPSYREGTPRSVLEAMATGRAVVTTDAPGCRNTVINNFNGFLVEPKNSVQLSNALEKLINDKNLISNMGKNSRKLAEDKFCDKRVADEMYRFVFKCF